MTPLILIIGIVALFAILLGYETSNDPTQPRLKPLGLLSWLTSGNWPAKVGAGLLILGIGALLRYALINVEMPPELKLGSGFVVAAILGAAAMALRKRPKRRAIHLALAGAAFGVAYLTAYGAYGFFHYINDVNALVFLALVSIAAGLFAVSSGAMSVAILAMAGAYIAPRFAIGSPGQVPVYGYYLAISALSFVMVAMRGWRPLIHLSFIFTLAGALFFGWTGKFYQAGYYTIMQPLLLALTTLHLAMPLMERRHIPSTWLSRFDLGYFIALPLVAAALTLRIAPNLPVEGATGLAALALIWASAAAVLAMQKRNEVMRHALVAVLLALGAGLCVVVEVPWLLVGLGLTIAAFAAAPRLGWSRGVEELLCGAASLFGVLHIVASVLQAAAFQPFLNDVFVQRAIASAMLGLGAWIAARRSISFAGILGVLAVVWPAMAALAELLQFHFDFVPQLIYSLILAVPLGMAIVGRMRTFNSVWGGLLLLALISCCTWAAHDVGPFVASAYLIITTITLLVMAFSSRDGANGLANDFFPSMALGLLPFVAVPWAVAIAEGLSIPSNFFEANFAIIGMTTAALGAKAWLSGSPRWNNRIWPLHFFLAASALLFVTLFYIERGPWPVVFELLALLYLTIYTWLRIGSENVSRAGAVMVIAFALVIQAMLLRVFGPDRIMNAADISQMRLPAVASLMWAILGAGLAWWGARMASRSLWSTGAVLLALAAAKLVLKDFGELDQLGNILALIGAGVVFLGVAWFAPIPPKGISEAVEKKPSKTSPLIKKSEPQQLENYSSNQSGYAYRTAASADEQNHVHEHELKTERIAKETKRPARATSYKLDAEGVNGLWFVFFGLAFCVFVIYLGGHKTRQNSQAHKEQIQQLAQAAADADRAEALIKPSEEPQEQVAPPPQAILPVKVTDACTSFKDQLPSEYILYAGGAYGGRRLGFQVDQSGHEATQFDVFVNEPGKYVVLALGAYEPSVWNVRWAPGTVIAGVFISGYHRQAVAGLTQDVPVLHSSYESRTPCGYFYLDRDDPSKTDTMIRKVFGRSAQTYFVASDGRINFGRSGAPDAQFMQDTHTPVESYRDKDAPLTGKSGIDQLIREGKLRSATREDGMAWRQAQRKARNQPQINVIGGSSEGSQPEMNIRNVYVVLKPMRFPSGLYGAHAVTFIIAMGVARPEGNPGHSSVLDMNAPN